MSSNVVSIDSRESFTSSRDQTFGTGLRGSVRELAVVAEVVESRSFSQTGELKLKQLYSELGDESRLIKALSAIERAKLCLESAARIDSELNYVAFDLELMSARSLLLNAFRYRDLGDGYAAVINATIWALSNRGTHRFTRRQINVLVAALNRVSEGPYLHFDTTSQILDELEDAELDIEPPSLDLLTRDLDD